MRDNRLRVVTLGRAPAIPEGSWSAAPSPTAASSGPVLREILTKAPTAPVRVKREWEAFEV